jgi:hypothetical protein
VEFSQHDVELSQQNVEFSQHAVELSQHAVELSLFDVELTPERCGTFPTQVEMLHALVKKSLVMNLAHNLYLEFCHY